MEGKRELDKETFLSLAKASDLDAKNSHLEELYPYVANVFPNFKVAHDIDLTNVEPMTTFSLAEE